MPPYDTFLDSVSSTVLDYQTRHTMPPFDTFLDSVRFRLSDRRYSEELHVKARHAKVSQDDRRHIS